jgi:preprotein translocase subunit SecE
VVVLIFVVFMIALVSSLDFLFGWLLLKFLG